ncbi:hypothetical protein ACFFWC_09485 [Plantactinospora siamensis]|uniref:Uncharacterized protein n=1 Tax=Plantactinospora siamensis TaxID=555372 RepID=A0ABV6P4J1_9ACTN
MSRRSRLSLAVLGALALVLPVGAATAPAGAADRRGAAPAAWDGAGLRPADWTVYGFSQSAVGPAEEDPQVYRLAPDVNIRAFQQWSTAGDEASDYNFGHLARYHGVGAALIGGGTASVIFREQFPSEADFADMSTRDADNLPLPHDEIVPNARRGNLFNPRFRRYLIDWARIQIDGGVDGLFLDEVLGGFSGGQLHGYNGDEGFDDYTIADFNRYLLATYPGFTVDDWKSRFGMTDDNVVRPDVPADDLTHNFNYRTYLRDHGWTGNPLTSANPLSGVWGRVTSNRMYADDASFTATYLRRYWKEIVDTLRAYANDTYHRPILITANGLFPYVDLNSVGMYPWNPDEQTPDGRGADYVPVVGGHLNGAKSLQANYRYLKDLGDRISGDVPTTVFIDWPTDMMSAYLNLPASERQDYWRIFGAEAYANGLFPAFFLKDTVGDPTADQLGLLGFLQTYAQFYRSHAALFRDNGAATGRVTAGAANVSASLLARRDTGARTLHLVNHNYNQRIIPQRRFTVTADVGACPAAVTVVSPDFTGTRKPVWSCRQGTLTVTVDRLDYYDVLALG